MIHIIEDKKFFLDISCILSLQAVN